MPVAECMARVDSDEFTQWQVLDREEPFDHLKWYLIQLTNLLANAHRDPDRTPEPWTFADHVLFNREEETEVEDEEAKRERVAASVRNVFGAINQVIQSNEARGGQ